MIEDIASSLLKQLLGLCLLKLGYLSLRFGSEHTTTPVFADLKVGIKGIRSVINL